MSNRIAADETLESRYFERMAQSLNDKARLLDFLPPVTDDYAPRILDVGAGGGELSNVLDKLGYSVTALDTNSDALDRISERFSNVEVLNSLANHVKDFGLTFDAIICSSILHEVYSYGDDVHRMGHVSSLGRAISAFRDVLAPGSRLLVRDGVRADDWAEQGFVEVLDGDESAVTEYLDLCPFANGDAYGKNGNLLGLTRVGEGRYSGTFRSCMEYAYTRNWGKESYPREAKELYGVLTLDDYADYVEGFGFTTIHKEAYLLPGYVTGLADKVRLLDADGHERPWFNSNAIWVYEVN
jgi:SAM-dependent methyltransferase